MIATDTPHVTPEEEEEGEKSKKKDPKGDKEYGVSRGIDFYRVANIINFDFPMDFDSYVHRVGRTARVDQKGMKIFFILNKKIFY
jgi:ATP-dependent RNA helicase DDX56/DBP9